MSAEREMNYSWLQDFIAESIFPSHIIVPRCSGSHHYHHHHCHHHHHHHHRHHHCHHHHHDNPDDHPGVCLDKVGETCLPKRKPKVFFLIETPVHQYFYFYFLIRTPVHQWVKKYWNTDDCLLKNYWNTSPSMIVFI